MIYWGGHHSGKKKKVPLPPLGFKHMPIQVWDRDKGRGAVLRRPADRATVSGTEGGEVYWVTSLLAVVAVFVLSVKWGQA